MKCNLGYLYRRDGLIYGFMTMGSAYPISFANTYKRCDTKRINICYKQNLYFLKIDNYLILVDEIFDSNANIKLE